MCSRLRTYAIRKLPQYDVELCYESGCDIITMIQWLRTPEGQSTRRRYPLQATQTTPTTTTTLQINDNNNMYIQRQYQPHRNNYYQQQNRISPVLLVSENNSREQILQIEKKTRPDTPVDPAAKRSRLFAHFVKPPRIAPRLQRQQQEIATQSEEEVIPSLPTTPPGLPAPPVLSPRQSTPRTPIAPPRPLDPSPQIKPSHQIENRNEPQVVENNPSTEQVIPMDQEI
ncbi:unnamed protein product, partial [Rotaria sp. Silwood1]